MLQILIISFQFSFKNVCVSKCIVGVLDLLLSVVVIGKALLPFGQKILYA